LEIQNVQNSIERKSLHDELADILREMIVDCQLTPGKRINEKQLTRCPACSGPVQKLISRTNISCPKSNSELRDLGFTKLVKRDDGVYENVTARNGDSRYMLKGKPETIPDISKTVSD
jgi:hypothetical protein